MEDRWLPCGLAAALQYLNKALEYLDEREKKEKEMLLKYMDKLPENWQVDLTLWRKEHGYHALTETRAKNGRWKGNNRRKSEGVICVK